MHSIVTTFRGAVIKAEVANFCAAMDTLIDQDDGEVDPRNVPPSHHYVFMGKYLKHQFLAKVTLTYMSVGAPVDRRRTTMNPAIIGRSPFGERVAIDGFALASILKLTFHFHMFITIVINFYY